MKGKENEATRFRYKKWHREGILLSSKEVKV